MKKASRKKKARWTSAGRELHRDGERVALIEARGWQDGADLAKRIAALLNEDERRRASRAEETPNE